jgi:hypothetical protein
MKLTTMVGLGCLALVITSVSPASAQTWVENSYVQSSCLIHLYNEEFGKPATELYELAKPLRKLQVNFTSPVDWSYWELWHHEGRRARHGASMMGPDYTHWHGTYEVAKSFYTHFVPDLRELLERAHRSEDPKKKAAAGKLEAKLHEVLNSPNHRWFIGKMDPEEAARRKKAQEEFKARYKK